jgi:hypothetical protein
MLTSLASVIGEPGQKALIDQGASVLTSYLVERHSQASARQLDNTPALAKAVLRACWDSLGQ